MDITCKRVQDTHLVELVRNFSSGMTSSPVTGSNGGRISNEARMQATASHTVASAKCIPGQILGDASVEVNVH